MSSETTRIEHFFAMDAMGNNKLMGELMDRVTLIAPVDCSQAQKESLDGQCKDLQTLYDRFKDQGFQIVVFPTDQKTRGESGEGRCSSECVKDHIEKRFNLTFPVMHKISSSGDNVHPLFLFLHRQLRDEAQDHNIKWDSTKFLVVDGEPAKKYAPTISVDQISEDINCFLKTAKNWPSVKSDDQPKSLKQQQQQQQYASVPPVDEDIPGVNQQQKSLSELEQTQARSANAPTKEVGDLDGVKKANRKKRS